MSESEKRERRKPDMRRQRGLAAESEAAAYLSRIGYVVSERNWRCRTGELDLIAADGDTIVIVEVRSRTAGGRFGTAVEAVTPRKQAQVRATAQVYLRFAGKEGMRIRFDVVAVTFDRSGRLEALRHLQGAF